MEAITSRPLLLAAVARATRSGGQTTLYLTPLHGKANLLKTLIANIHAALQHVTAAAQLVVKAARELPSAVALQLFPAAGQQAHRFHMSGGPQVVWPEGQFVGGVFLVSALPGGLVFTSFLEPVADEGDVYSVHP